ncbi:transcriptional regulator [Sorangium cellulosum]|uniref:Transcriptional regulator n=1 Tax=Sorangium cellulosum TaxID=56 RepID=A0A2L0F634_SORCE|nr:TetR/AcrR family transcriptional regulator [Sorangium cellulosum]AUX46899.1 transcriptional regulator [Sorangium cellulosum]
MRTVNPDQHEKKRRELLRAAQRRFAAEGVQASIASICAEAGVSPGHLYHYFSSKEAILEGLFQLVLDEAAAHLSGDVQDARDLPALVADLYSSGKGPSLLFDLLAESQRNAAIADRLRRHSAEMKQLLAGAIARGQAAGLVDDTLPAPDLATLLLAVLDGSKAIRLRDPAVDRGQAREMLLALVSRVLSTSGGRPGAGVGRQRA